MPKAKNNIVSKISDSHPVAIVIGLDCITGLQIARVLHRHGIEVIGIANDPEHFSVQTRCVSSLKIVDRNGQALLECLRTLATKNRPALMPATDAAVMFMTQNSEELSRLFRIASPGAKSVEHAIGKAPFALHARKYDIPVPRTRVVKDIHDLHRAAEELTAPYVLKPNLKSPSWDALAGFKVLLAKDSTALEQGYERCKNWCDYFVVQEWVEGSDDAMYSYYAFVAADGQVVAECAGHKIRQWPRLTGSGTLSEICDDPEILKTGRALLQSLDHRGFATVNMKRDTNTGKLFVIEINPGRPGMGMFVAEAAGIEMTHLAYQSLVGQPLSSAPLIQFPNARWISMKRDFASAFAGWRRGELSLAGYLRSIRGVRRRAVFDLRDPLPFLYDLLRSPGQVYRRRTKENSSQ